MPELIEGTVILGFDPLIIKGEKGDPGTSGSGGGGSTVYGVGLSRDANGRPGFVFDGSGAAPLTVTKDANGRPTLVIGGTS